MAEASHLQLPFIPDSATTFFYIGLIRQKVRELQPVISNVMGFDTCVMVSSLEKFVKLQSTENLENEKVMKVGVGGRHEG